jgi:hypothetical protein
MVCVDCSPVVEFTVNTTTVPERPEAFNKIPTAERVLASNVMGVKDKTWGSGCAQ